MPLIETRPDALAETYARSLIELAESQGGSERVEVIDGQLEDILELARADARFSEFLASPAVPMAARARSLRQIFSGRIDDLLFRFLLVVNDKGRLSHLPAIAAAYDQIVQEKFGRVEVDVFTAAPIRPEDRRAITDRLREVLGKEPVVHPYTEPAMIGGIRIRIGDRLIDGSVATQLRRLREHMIRTGAPQIRARAERLIDGELGG